MITMNSKPYTVKSHRLRVRCSSCLYPNCSTDPFSSAIVTSTNVDSTFAARNKRCRNVRPWIPLPGRASLRKRWGAPLRFPYTKRPALSGEAVPSRFPPFSPFGKLETYFSPPSLRGGKAITGRATKGLSSRNSYNSGLSERLGTEMRSTISTGQGWQP